MAKTPPSRSYRLFSGMVCLACAYTLSASAKATGTAVSASPATTLRLVIEVERARAIGYLLGDGSKRMLAPCTCLIGALLAAHLDGFEGKRFPSKPNWMSGPKPAPPAHDREMSG